VDISKRLVFFTVLSTVMFVGLLEFLARAQSVEKDGEYDSMEGFTRIVNEPISSRELDNRFIKHNIHLLQTLEDKESYDVALIGTSRTKALSSSRFGYPNYFNSSGNSYNEITYGLLVEAEALYEHLPDLRKIYVEASMLLRRPRRSEYSAEEDHLTYLPILKRFSDIRNGFPGVGFESFVNRKPKRELYLKLFNERDKYIASSLLFGGHEFGHELITSSRVFDEITSFGEYRNNFSFENGAPKPAISLGNPKVQRIKNIGSYESFDYLFEMIVSWARYRDIEVVFFQPPVRGDLQSFQYRYGLDHHNDALRTFAHEYQVGVINMNYLDSGFSSKWQLFSDEDHMATCTGNAAIFSSLEVGESVVGSLQKYYVEVSSVDVAKKERYMVSKFCSGS